MMFGGGLLTSRKSSTYGVRFIDLFYVSLLLAPSIRSFYSEHYILGAILFFLSLFVLGCSSGTALWLSKAHLDVHTTTASSRVTNIRHRRNIGRHMPCPYPDAWYTVALSAELKPGDILDINVCGRALVVFRPKSGGKPSVLDAYCSHLGAHLAHGGGSLVDDCIRCPFHGWCYDGNGKLIKTETGDTIPPGSDLKSWPVIERNGLITIWMSAAVHNEKIVNLSVEETQPWFEAPIFPELEGKFDYHGFSEHTVPALIFELPENGADVGHLTALHNAFIVASLRPLLSHKWAASWRADEKEAHIARLKIKEYMVLLGFTLPGPVEVEITQVGPSQVYLDFSLPGIGRLIIMETVTPMAPTQMRVLHACYASPHVPRLVAKTVLAAVNRAYEQDLPVWAHKRYEPAPRLTSSESAIKIYRGWVKQFIKSPNAITFEEAQKKQLKIELGLPDDSTMNW
jgi:cholesterol 7-desaturase